MDRQTDRQDSLFGHYLVSNQIVEGHYLVSNQIWTKKALSVRVNMKHE